MGLNAKAPCLPVRPQLIPMGKKEHVATWHIPQISPWLVISCCLPTATNSILQQLGHPTTTVLPRHKAQGQLGRSFDRCPTSQLSSIITLHSGQNEKSPKMAPKLKKMVLNNKYRLYNATKLPIFPTVHNTIQFYRKKTYYDSKHLKKQRKLQ